MDLPPPKIRFLLANGLKESDVRNAPYFIYAHVCRAGMYVGLSKDPVKRWQEHFSNAFNEGYRDYDDDFRVAIRGWKHNFKHYILAVSKFEKGAKNKEASAIDFYPCNLNMKNEVNDSDRDFGFRKIEGQIFTPIMLSKKTNKKQGDSRTDKDRVSVVGIVYKGLGRKRLKSIAGQPFNEGLSISCNKKELEKFDYGSKVRLKVSKMSREGKDYLKAPDSAVITKV
jgi:predicted GIY-YIG superfamily endonuclease